MCIAPFFIETMAGKLAIILGLILLTIQAINLEAYNLVFTNIVGIIGYMTSIIRIRANG
jgi:hypothetical protein